MTKPTNRYSEEQLKKFDSKRLTSLYNRWTGQDADVGEFPRSGMIAAILGFQQTTDFDAGFADAQRETLSTTPRLTA